MTLSRSLNWTLGLFSAYLLLLFLASRNEQLGFLVGIAILVGFAWFASLLFTLNLLVERVPPTTWLGRGLARIGRPQPLFLKPQTTAEIRWTMAFAGVLILALITIQYYRF